MNVWHLDEPLVSWWRNLLPITCQVSESPTGYDVFLLFQVAKIQLNFNLHLP